ncbi:MAG: DUF302 domain-containing protein [Nostoc sp.]|uniref:DUF302 domain-containing protein n=1 Tax=Nostoc sp. TaxID=1180 RepID=UPI002FFCFD4D
METLTLSRTHIIVSSDKSFEQVVEAIESIAMTDKLDLAVVEQIVLASNSWDEFQEALQSKIGSSGLMTFTKIDHGSLMSLAFEGNKAKLYVIGNPLIAKQMLEQNLGVGLYVPLRMLVYENQQGKTQISYEKPSSLLGQFQNDKILAIALMLDRKLEELTTKVTVF